MVSTHHLERCPVFLADAPRNRLGEQAPVDQLGVGIAEPPGPGQGLVVPRAVHHDYRARRQKHGMPRGRAKNSAAEHEHDAR